MIYTIKIKLESPLLGNTADGTKIKRFERAKDQDKIMLSSDVFQWAVNESLGLLRLDQVVNQDYFVEILPMQRPALSLYNRNYKDKISGKPKSSQYECIRSGAVITFDVLVLGNLPKSVNSLSLRRPTDKEIEFVFSTIGKFFSLSPWGCATGKYGRFELLECNIKQLENEST